MGFQIGSMPGDMMQDYVNRMQPGKKDRPDAPGKKEKPFGKAMEGAQKKEASSWEKPGATYDKGAQKAVDKGFLYGNMAVRKNITAEKTEGPQLSEKAQKLLDELKEKYGNMDFFIAKTSGDEEAQSIMSQGTKEYSVLIDPDTLEKMAEDEDFKNKCIAGIEESTSKLGDLFEELGEDADKIESVGIRVGADGTMEFFAKLRESSDEQRERIEEQKEQKLEEKREEELKLKASSLEELLEKLRELGIGVKDEEPDADEGDVIPEELAAIAGEPV